MAAIIFSFLYPLVKVALRFTSSVFYLMDAYFDRMEAAADHLAKFTWPYVPCAAKATTADSSESSGNSSNQQLDDP